ncbi:MAG: helix-turn-helix transcriptional regulator [Flavobacteriia bacterium]|nr:helix-turn-helix transcriptional regulator [Flavobacteriia bacterium]
MEDVLEFEKVKSCSKQFVLAINDTLNVMNGKWKLPIIGSLLYGKKRFKELEREIPKITPRMLSKELKDLEMNGIIKRTVYNTIPVSVEYELTESGHSFQSVLDAMLEWGLGHRKSFFTNFKKVDSN